MLILTSIACESSRNFIIIIMKTIEQIYKELLNEILSLNKEIYNLSIQTAYDSHIYITLNVYQIENTDEYLKLLDSQLFKLDSLLLEYTDLIKEIDKLPRNYRKQLIKYIL